MMRILCLLVCTMQLLACAGLRAEHESRYNGLAIDLRRLGNAVQGEVWRGAAPDADVLALACSRDLALCAPFEPGSVLVSIVDTEVALLLCDSGHTQAIIEDIACTPETDRRAWEEGPAPCVFTLDVAAACNN